MRRRPIFRLLVFILLLILIFGIIRRFRQNQVSPGITPTPAPTEITTPTITPSLTGGLTPSVTSVPEAMLKTGNYIYSFSNTKRTYKLFVANGYKPGNVLVVALHPSGKDGAFMESSTGFSNLASSGTAVAYPDGTACNAFKTGYIWNSAAYKCNSSNDLGYIKALTDYLKDNLKPSKVIIVGHSGGAMLAYNMAANYPQTYSAAGIVAGAIGGAEPGSQNYIKISVPPAPIKILIIHSKNDGIVPYIGGPSQFAPNATFSFTSVNEAFDFWVQSDGCNSGQTSESEYISNVTLKQNNNCNGGSFVKLYSLDGGNHLWPSGGFVSGGFNASDVIWNELVKK